MPCWLFFPLTSQKLATYAPDWNPKNLFKNYFKTSKHFVYDPYSAVSCYQTLMILRYFWTLNPMPSPFFFITSQKWNCFKTQKRPIHMILTQCPMTEDKWLWGIFGCWIECRQLFFSNVSHFFRMAHVVSKVAQLRV